MNSTFRTMLFATALFPVAALAQDATQQQGEQPLLPDANQQQDMNAAPADPNAPSPAEATDTGAGTTTETEVDVTIQPAPDGSQTDTTTTVQETPDATQPDADMSAQPAPDAIEVETETITTDTAAAEIDTFVTVPPQGAWRVADLTGKDVFGADNEDIGEINDVIVGQDGRVIAVIVGVGGFLGIGEKDVAVSMEALQFKPGITEEELAAAGGGQATMEPAETGAVVETPAGEALPTEGADVETDVAAEVEIGADALPSRIVLNVTREQLEEAPTFEGIRPQNVDVDADMDLEAEQPVQ